MEQDPHGIEDRIGRLLDQLENPLLSDQEVQKIQRKIEFLNSMKQ